MVHLKRILAVLFLTLAVLPAMGQGSACIPVEKLEEDSFVFKGGERLTYSLHYKWGLINADVAKATMNLDTTVLNGRKVFHAHLNGKTQKIYNSLFRVDEDLQSWFTRDKMRPLKFTRRALEGNYTCTNLYTYDWTPGAEQINAALNTSRKGDFSATLKLTPCTYDIPSLLYMLRNIDSSKLKEGASYPMVFAVDDDVSSLKFIYYGKEDRNVPGLGTVRCLKFGLQVVAGEVFSGDSDLYAWFSDDGNRIPVWFVAPLKIGKAQGRLIEYSGIKHPFDSIVKKK